MKRYYERDYKSGGITEWMALYGEGNTLEWCKARFPRVVPYFRWTHIYPTATPSERLKIHQFMLLGYEKWDEVMGDGK